MLRTVEPPLAAVGGKTVRGLRRIGKRIVFALDDELFLVIHLMVAGRLKWHDKTPKLGRRLALAAIEFDSGTLVLTEAGTKRRASIYVVRGERALRELDRGGIEVLDASRAEFVARLRSENHTLKRALADPRLFSGIGNAYSDEILHRARLSPLMLTSRLTEEEAARLHAAVRSTLTDWIARLRAETGAKFPEKVTAFRTGMAVHGKFRQPCPCAARRSSGSGTRTTRRTTAPSARREGSCWRTGGCRVCSRRIGRGRWMRWRSLYSERGATDEGNEQRGATAPRRGAEGLSRSTALMVRLTRRPSP